MGIISWILLGALAGWIAKSIMKEEGGLIKNIIIGVLGALIGGFVFGALGGGDISGFNIYSILVSVVGAILLIFVVRLVTKDQAKK